MAVLIKNGTIVTAKANARQIFAAEGGITLSAKACSQGR